MSESFDSYKEHTERVPRLIARILSPILLLFVAIIVIASFASLDNTHADDMAHSQTLDDVEQKLEEKQAIAMAASTEQSVHAELEQFEENLKPVQQEIESQKESLNSVDAPFHLRIVEANIGTSFLIEPKKHVEVTATEIMDVIQEDRWTISEYLYYRKE